MAATEGRGDAGEEQGLVAGLEGTVGFGIDQMGAAQGAAVAAGLPGTMLRTTDIRKQRSEGELRSLVGLDRLDRLHNPVGITHRAARRDAGLKGRTWLRMVHGL